MTNHTHIDLTQALLNERIVDHVASGDYPSAAAFYHSLLKQDHHRWTPSQAQRLRTQHTVLAGLARLPEHPRLAASLARTWSEEWASMVSLESASRMVPVPRAVHAMFSVCYQAETPDPDTFRDHILLLSWLYESAGLLSDAWNTLYYGIALASRAFGERAAGALMCRRASFVERQGAEDVTRLELRRKERCQALGVLASPAGGHA